jgi:hypothetical protein
MNDTNRPEGLYWIKRAPKWSWEPGLWRTEYKEWIVLGDDETWPSSDLYQIGDTVDTPAYAATEPPLS